ncbi:MAG: glycosyltransferase family 1 protein [Planctomycetota bacterium]
MLRVALDFRPALLTPSGIGRATRELARALAELPHIELHLFGHSLARAVNRDVPTAAHLHRWRVPGRSLRMLRALGLGADRLAGSPDVFHWTDYVQPPLSRARAVLTVHDVAFAEDPMTHGERQSAILRARTAVALAAAARVVVPTEATAQALRTRFEVDPDHVRVIPFGADHVPSAATLRARPAPLGGEDYVLMVGTLEPRKNHLRLLRAWRELPAPRPRLVVVGRAGWLCEDTVRALRATAREGVRWIPGLDDGELWRYVAHARLLAYPSLLEGFGFPPLEALALGVPVLAGDTPALREVLGDAALFRPPGDIDALRDGLEVLLHDDGTRRRLREQGLRRAREFTWSTCARAHAEVYAEAAG